MEMLKVIFSRNIEHKDKYMNVNVVTVIGATGTMGANVAGIFASFGEAKVYCLARDIEKVKNTIPKIVSSVKADSIAKNLFPADFSMLEKCVAESDLVFESVAESLDVKKAVHGQIGESLREGAISCTGSSGLSITTIAECYPENKRNYFFGVHMFNPPYSLSLCELTATKYSNMDVYKELEKYLSTRLIRTVVKVKDAPAFLGNRIGFQFLNEALQYAEKYKDNGGIDYIDAILGPFTGRAMQPLVTADFVGLDVHMAIVDNLYKNTCDFAHETFVFPLYAKKLVEAGKLGRKRGEGLYKTIKYENGLKRSLVLDLESDTYRDKIDYVFPFADKMKKRISNGDYAEAFAELINNHSQEAEICLSFLLKYIVYSLFAAKEVGFSVHAADDVMATGFNWCPPLAMYDAFSTVTKVDELIKNRLGDFKGINIDELLTTVEPSRYDYRIYFKSGR